MKKIIKGMNLVEMNQLLTFLNENGIELKPTFKKTYEAIEDLEMDRLLLLKILEIKLDFFKLAILDHVNNKPIRSFKSYKRAPIEGCKSKFKMIERSLPFIDGLNVEMLVKILGYYYYSYEDMLESLTVKKLTKSFEKVISFITDELGLRTVEEFMAFEGVIDSTYISNWHDEGEAADRADMDESEEDSNSINGGN